ncbi:hypothetical protein CDD82_6679 [Ophiocordyceps australis]|uniref:Uncharacterized protein n=1 Tax=Ophiocordyceps australis TaxID=1399860 RepID=A0A2C5YNW0_9HYPO|nr:hypothetical protein CDD82_6679 [Ophiocordyceps australis]
MAFLEIDSTHVEFCTPYQPVKDKPSPLRIIKKSNKDASVADPTTDLSKFPLKVAKKHSRKQASNKPGCSAAEHRELQRPNFWASSVELGRAPTRGWEDRLMRCRRLLTRSLSPAKDTWAQEPEAMCTPLSSSRRTPSTTSQPQPCGNSSCSSWHTSSRDPSASKSCTSRGSSGSDLSPSCPLAIKMAGPAPPFVLSPCITVTSELTCHEHGRQTVWAAIEVTGRLSSITSSRSSSESSAALASMTGSFVEHQLDRFFEFGCLYDLTVQVLPTAGTRVVAIMQEQAFPTTIYAGSSVFLLAHLEIDLDTHRRRSGTKHVRQKSDELIEDLELELGSSVAGYMRVHVSYSHSAFPEYSGSGAHTVGGVFALRSRLETAATATLKSRRPLSLWSPRPEYLQAHVLSLVERHWGVDKALSVKRQMGADQGHAAVQHAQTPRKLRKTPSKTTACDGSDWPLCSTPRPVYSVMSQRPPRPRSPKHHDSTLKALTFGRALGSRAQRLLSVSPTSTPSSMAVGGAKGVDGSLPCHSGACDGKRPDYTAATTGINGAGHGLREVKSFGAEALRGWTPTVTGWSEATADDDEAGKTGDNKSRVGMWGWGLWF